MRGLIGFLAVAAMASSSAAAEDIVLEPNQKWVADYGENACRLIRSFGEKDEPTVLIIRQTAPTSDFSWTVAGPQVKRTRWHRPVTVQWGPQLDPYEVEFREATLSTIGPAYISSGWSRGEEAPSNKTSKKALRDLGEAQLADGVEPVLAEVDTMVAAGIDYVSFTQGRSRLVLQLSDFSAALSALNTCSQKLAEEWGFDKSYYKKVSSKPVWSNVGEVARKIQQNYPSRALFRGAQANFEMRIIVGPDEKPERCDWLNETEADAFDMKRTPCDFVVEGAEFEPALDQNDQPIRSIFMTKVVYRMP